MKRAIGLMWAVLLCAPASAGATTGLAVVGPTGSSESITLSHGPSGELEGTLDLALENTSREPGTVIVTYIPAGDHAAPSSALKPAKSGRFRIRPRQVRDLTLKASLPGADAPSDLAGVVEVGFRHGKVVDDPVVVTVRGTSPAVNAITISPGSIQLQVVRWAGPFGAPKQVTAEVQLRGADLESLFSPGFLRSRTFLRSGDGKQLVATLTAEPPTNGDSVALGHLVVTGSFDAGSYTGSLPLSGIGGGTPAVALTVKSGDAFLWALLMVVLGVVAGGGVYLASNLKRRKVVLQENVRDALDRYVETRDKLVNASPTHSSPVWSMPDLGEQEDWFKQRWTALPQLDGVRGIWSEVYWARNNDDLDAAETDVLSLLSRVLRWMRVATGDALASLTDASRLAPTDPPTLSWRRSATDRNTDELLRVVQEEEPSDDAALQTLIDRINRQARWHAALATTWHKDGVITAAIAAQGSADSPYTSNDKKELNDIDLGATDQAASLDRSDADQEKAEAQLDEWDESLIAMFKGDDQQGFLVCPGPEEAVILGSLTADQARPLPGPELVTPNAARSEPAAEAPTRESRGKESTAWIRGLTARDFLWTAIVVVITAAVYVPTLYSSTWGTLGDYGSAFAAGFVGKVAINWAVLPLFTSITLRAKPAAATSSQDGSSPAAQATTTTS